ncbi:MAG: type II secretion system protein GspJ [Desulfobacterales bacterium]|nr:type II secretion system protein GspJ [Desulfobacterales bacterium]
MGATRDMRAIKNIKQSGHGRRRAGFTLLEILIAMFIFAVIVTTIFGSYRAVFSTIGPMNEGIKTYEMALNGLNRISVDLQSMVIAWPPRYTVPDFNSRPDPYRIQGDTEHTGGTDFPRLRFTSLAHISFQNKPEEDIAEIVYYVRPSGEDTTFVIKRSDRLEPYPTSDEKGEESNDPVLSEQVKSLTFKYYDHNGAVHERWDSESHEFEYATPVAIDITLELEDKGGTHLFHTIVKLPLVRKPKK